MDEAISKDLLSFGFSDKNLLKHLTSSSVDKIKLPSLDWIKNSSKLAIQKMLFQKVFNLLREESEGYSRLISILNSPWVICLQDRQELGLLTKRMMELIGIYNLCPKRALD